MNTAPLADAGGVSATRPKMTSWPGPPWIVKSAASAGLAAKARTTARVLTNDRGVMRDVLDMGIARGFVSCDGVVDVDLGGRSAGFDFGDLLLDLEGAQRAIRDGLAHEKPL